MQRTTKRYSSLRQNSNSRRGGDSRRGAHAVLQSIPNWLASRKVGRKEGDMRPLVELLRPPMVLDDRARVMVRGRVKTDEREALQRSGQRTGERVPRP